MNNETIKQLYQENRWTLRMIADKYGTNHHLIKRKLQKMGVKITNKDRVRKPVSDEHKKKISESRERLRKAGWKPYNLGKKMPKASLYKNMATHLKADVSSEWLSQFEDIEKLKFLNRAIAERSDNREGKRWGIDTRWYKDYILKFYYDKQFNDIYSRWLSVGKKDKYLIPSIDHIDPKANGGSNDLNNLQFLTWFENRAKNDLPQVEWQRIKDNIKDYLI